MQAASGFQVAFLILAFAFFSMLVTRWLADFAGVGADRFEPLSQLVTFVLAAVTLVAVPALRRFCVAQLRPPIPSRFWPEVVGISVVKLALPFAVWGGFVAWTILDGQADDLSSRFRFADPVARWAWTLSLWGFLHLVVLSWIIGPIIEELVFRGFLYQAFERRWSWLPAMALTSLTFGLAHPSRIAMTALGSVVFICVLRRTGSLRACIVVHALYNALVSWPLLGQLMVTRPAGDLDKPATWWWSFACLAFVAIALPVYIWMSRQDSRPAPAL